MMLLPETQFQKFSNCFGCEVFGMSHVVGVEVLQTYYLLSYAGG